MNEKTSESGNWIPIIRNDREKLFDFLGKLAICAFAVFLFCRAFLGPIWFAEIDSNALFTIVLQYRGSYTAIESDLQQAQIDFPQLYAGIESYDDLRSGKLWITKDGQWFPTYGPIYALLCIPIKLLLAFFRVGQDRCFLLTNAVLILISLCFLQRRLKVSSAQRLAALLLLMISPIIFYVNYINYEACIFSLLIISLTLYYNGNRKLSAFFLSLAGIANHTIMAVGIVMIGEYFIRMVCAIRNEPDKRSTLRAHAVETIVYGCCFLPCLIPFVAQWFFLGEIAFLERYGTITQLLPRFFSYLFDPSLGFFSFAPFSVLAFFILGIVSLFKRRNPERWQVLTWLLFLVATVLAYSLMVHINCGMIYCARYIVWTYPIIAIYLATFGYKAVRSVPIKMVTCMILVASSAILILVNMGSALDSYSFNPVTKWILNYVPQIYHPLSSTFYCRTLHEDGAYGHTEMAYYTDPQTNEIRKLIYKAYPGAEEEILQDLTGDEASMQFLHSRLSELKYDDKFHYLNFPKNGSYQLRKKTPEETGEFVPGKVLIDERNIFLDGLVTRSTALPTTISANTFYKLEIELGEEFDYDETGGLFVDFLGEGYDLPETDAYLLVPEQERYEFYFYSGNNGWETKDIVVRFICCATSKKPQEPVRIDHFVLTESNRAPSDDSAVFRRAIYFDGSAQDAHRYFLRGMSETETDFAWTDGTEVQCRFSLAEEDIGDLQLRLNLRTVYHAPQRLRVTCGDRVLYEAAISDAETSVDIPIPADCVQDGNVSLTLDCPDAVSPASLGESEDTRYLAFAIESIELLQ